MSIKRIGVSLATAAALSAALVGALVFAWPTSDSGNTVDAAASCGPAVTTNIDGSTTVFPIMNQGKAGFDAAFPGAVTSLGDIGSAAGIAELNSGVAEVAPSSRTLTPAELVGNHEWSIAFDAFVIGVRDTIETGNDPSVDTIDGPMSFLNVGLDKNKLRTIYQAQAGITTLFWDDASLAIAGAPHRLIIPVGRASTSGSRADFVSSIGGGLTTGQHDTTITTAGGAGNLFVESLEVAQDVAANQDHIGYTSLANLDVPNLGVVKMSGIYPSTGTVLNGTYPMPRELFLAVRGTAARSRLDFTDQVYGDDWVNYFRSAPGIAAITAQGFLPRVAAVNQPIPDADVNMDGATGLPDVGQIIQKWGISSACSGWIRADVNNNAAVGLTDVGGLIQRWGQPGFTCAVGTNCPTS